MAIEVPRDQTEVGAFIANVRVVDFDNQNLQAL
jgi:hypothetical protein